MNKLNTKTWNEIEKTFGKVIGSYGLLKAIIYAILFGYYAFFVVTEGECCVWNGVIQDCELGMNNYVSQWKLFFLVEFICHAYLLLPNALTLLTSFVPALASVKALCDCGTCLVSCNVFGFWIFGAINRWGQGSTCMQIQGLEALGSGM